MTHSNPTLSLVKSSLYSNLIPILIGFLVFLMASCQDDKQKDNGDFYYSGQDTIKLNIPSDSMGILIANGKNVNDLKKVLETEGLAVVRTIEDQLFIVVSSNKKGVKKADLVAHTTSLKAKYKDLIAQAGYLAYPQESKVPMVVTDELVVDFAAGTSQNDMDNAVTANGLQVVMQNPFIKTQYLLKAKDAARADVLAMSRNMAQVKGMKYAHPNFLIYRELRATIPNDALFNNQWHHLNTGQSGGTVDADIDIELAWDFTRGNPNTLIAILDNGFDMTHPDLTPNFRGNSGEGTVPNGVDNDGNTLIDDIQGWDFSSCVGAPGTGCGDNIIDVGNHGTATSGVAAARGNNSIGVSGSCPTCSILPIRIAVSFTSPWADALAFGYAQSRRANIISCSWGYSVGTPTTATLVTAINNVVAAGVTVFFAMNNPNVNDCGATPDISSLPSVIAISRSTNLDRFDNSGFGNCMDLLAPTRNSNASFGTLGITTTDVQGTAGYNSGVESCPRISTVNNNYTSCFNGTSSATPLTAGVAGLLVSADNTLTPRQIQNLLQDCADKIEHSLGLYATNTGFSSPASGNATHGYGRVNAFEAVRIAAPVSSGGKGGVDIFLRDNALDWGNTEQPSNTLFEPVRGFIPHFQSVDIKVDALPYATAPTTSAQFDAFVDERPLGGSVNKVYVRVHNRGYRAASSVTVKLHWVYAGLTFPNLPSDFWTRFPADASDVSIWHPLGTNTITNLGYSGCSVAGSATDASQIVSFDFDAPVPDPSMPNHYCLMALIDAPEDRLITASVGSNFNMDAVTPFSNNATHRNITIDNTRSQRDFTEQFNITNPFKSPIDIQLAVINPYKINYKFGDSAFDKLITLKPNETRLVKMAINTEGLNQEGEMTVQQVRRIKNDKIKGGLSYNVMGGITFRFVNQK